MSSSHHPCIRSIIVAFLSIITCHMSFRFLLMLPEGREEDWNSPFVTSCLESSYQDLFRSSSIPVYFIPGDNEYNDCPNPTQAFEFWYEYLLEYETMFWDPPTAYNITRQYPNYPENFAFSIHEGLLLVGINLVGGVVHNTTEWQLRFQANLDWIDEQYHTHQGQEEYSAMVIFGQATSDFFDTLFQRVEQDYSDIDIIYIHRNLGLDSWGLEPNYQNIPNLKVVVVEGDFWPPMLVKIDASARIVDINQSEQWYIDYLRDGEL